MRKTNRPTPPLAATALFACLALAAGRDAAFAAPLKSDSVVKATAVAEKPGTDGKQVVTLTLAIDKGWHLYANPVGAEIFANVQTTIKVKARGALDNVKIDYPSGKTVKDPTEGVYHIYEDKAVIVLSATRAKDDDSPLELTVQVQACNDNTCLMPAEIKLTAP